MQPIGSRFYVNPNDFLEAENADVDVINRRIKNGFKELIATTKEPIITESWLQYYEPTEGRGHNAHIIIDGNIQKKNLKCTQVVII